MKLLESVKISVILQPYICIRGSRNKLEALMRSRNELADKIIDLTMDAVFKMDYYDSSGIEFIKIYLENKRDNIVSLVTQAIWVLENNVKKVVANQTRIQNKFPNWEEVVQSKIQILHIYAAGSGHNERIDKLENENIQLKSLVNNLETKVDNLNKQMESLQKIIETMQLNSAEEKKSSQQNRGIFRFGKK
jgi:vacuolar-type H+-ATPase subunit I/STV1